MPPAAAFRLLSALTADGRGDYSKQLTSALFWRPMNHARYPSTRLRRNRRTDWSRRLVAEQTLSPNDLIWPVFIIEGERRRIAVETMPGVDRLSIDLAVKAAEEAAAL